MLLSLPTDLEHFPAHCWSMLEHAAAARDHAWHTPVIASTNGRQPGLRTVVLRHADMARNILECHTDTRSAKVSELAAQPALAWLFYDPASKQQLRCRGSATLHRDDATAEDAWSRLGAGSRSLYAQPQAPASPIDHADKPTASNDAFEFFCVISCRLEEMDWLELSAGGNQRVLMSYGKSGWRAMQVNP